MVNFTEQIQYVMLPLTRIGDLLAGFDKMVLNAPRPIVAGGTGATNAVSALNNLGGEARLQQVTNYDSQIWTPGSFYSAAGATSAPVAALDARRCANRRGKAHRRGGITLRESRPQQADFSICFPCVSHCVVLGNLT
jgi:hypothetical protein